MIEAASKIAHRGAFPVAWQDLKRRELPWFLGLAAVVLLSFWLTPSPDLYGTHRQLGLPPCPMMALFHVRCPTCGLTTSFAASAHGQWRMAFRAHPAGPFLWTATFAGALLFLYQLASRRRLSLGLSRRAQSRLVLAAFAVTVTLGVLRNLFSG